MPGDKRQAARGRKKRANEYEAERHGQLQGHVNHAHKRMRHLQLIDTDNQGNDDNHRIQQQIAVSKKSRSPCRQEKLQDQKSHRHELHHQPEVVIILLPLKESTPYFPNVPRT